MHQISFTHSSRTNSSVVMFGLRNLAFLVLCMCIFKLNSAFRCDNRNSTENCTTIKNNYSLNQTYEIFEPRDWIEDLKYLDHGVVKTPIQESNQTSLKPTIFSEFTYCNGSKTVSNKSQETNRTFCNNYRGFHMNSSGINQLNSSHPNFYVITTPMNQTINTLAGPQLYNRTLLMNNTITAMNGTISTLVGAQCQSNVSSLNIIPMNQTISTSFGTNQTLALNNTNNRRMMVKHTSRHIMIPINQTINTSVGTNQTLPLNNTNNMMMVKQTIPINRTISTSIGTNQTLPLNNTNDLMTIKETIPMNQTISTSVGINQTLPLDHTTNWMTANQMTPINQTISTLVGTNQTLPLNNTSNVMMNKQAIPMNQTSSTSVLTNQTLLLNNTNRLMMVKEMIPMNQTIGTSVVANQTLSLNHTNVNTNQTSSLNNTNVNTNQTLSLNSTNVDTNQTLSLNNTNNLKIKQTSDEVQLSNQTLRLNNTNNWMLVMQMMFSNKTTPQIINEVMLLNRTGNNVQTGNMSLASNTTDQTGIVNTIMSNALNGSTENVNSTIMMMVTNSSHDVAEMNQENRTVMAMNATSNKILNGVWNLSAINQEPAMKTLKNQSIMSNALNDSTENVNSTIMMVTNSSHDVAQMNQENRTLMAMNATSNKIFNGVWEPTMKMLKNQTHLFIVNWISTKTEENEQPTVLKRLIDNVITTCTAMFVYSMTNPFICNKP